MNTTASCIRNALDFLYPPVCLSCKAIIEHPFTTLCQPCFESLQLLSTFHRCRRCFHHLDEGGHRCQRSTLKSQAACFDDAPTPRALLSSSPSAIAPFIVMQWGELQWPAPDLIIPTPGDWFSRGNDRWLTRKEIAHSVAHLFSRPCLSCLRLHRHLLPLPYLSLEEQPPHVGTETVNINKPEAIINMNILMIHDVLTTGTALRTAAAALIHNGAADVWGISVISG